MLFAVDFIIEQLAWVMKIQRKLFFASSYNITLQTVSKCFRKLEIIA
jgi:hypothetical protein